MKTKENVYVDGEKLRLIDMEYDEMRMHRRLSILSNLIYFNVLHMQNYSYHIISILLLQYKNTLVYAHDDDDAGINNYQQ